MSENFWSRRRAAVQAEALADEKAKAAEALATEHAALEEQSDEEILAHLDLPDPDSLKEGDDFSVFMANVVPDRIRRRALRTLWKSNPILANVDHLVEYGEDYTDSATVVENLQTAYQVGKGMLKHVEELARQAEELETPDAEQIEEAPEEEVIVAKADVEETQETLTETGEVSDEIVLPPRRMKFRVEETA